MINSVSIRKTPDPASLQSCSCVCLLYPRRRYVAFRSTSTWCFWASVLAASSRVLHRRKQLDNVNGSLSTSIAALYFHVVSLREFSSFLASDSARKSELRSSPMDFELPAMIFRERCNVLSIVGEPISRACVAHRTATSRRFNTCPQEPADTPAPFSLTNVGNSCR